MKLVQCFLIAAAIAVSAIPVSANYWECKAASCEARVIQNGTTTPITVLRNGTIVEPGGGALLILDGANWHHVPT